jgi:hypothetical protein
VTTIGGEGIVTAQGTGSSTPGTPPSLGTSSVAAALPAGRRPLGPGAISVAGVALALLTTASGVVGVRDALTRTGLLTGQPWLDAAIEGLAGLRPQWWGVPLGCAAVITGLWLLLAAVWPRRRNTLSVTSRTGVVLTRRAARRLAVHAAQDVDGVLSARARVGRRRIAVTTVVTGEPSAVSDDVQRAVEERLAVLRPPARVRATARTESAR